MSDASGPVVLWTQACAPAAAPAPASSGFSSCRRCSVMFSPNAKLNRQFFRYDRGWVLWLWITIPRFPSASHCRFFPSNNGFAFLNHHILVALEIGGHFGGVENRNSFSPVSHRMLLHPLCFAVGALANRKTAICVLSQRSGPVGCRLVFAANSVLQPDSARSSWPLLYRHVRALRPARPASGVRCKPHTNGWLWVRSTWVLQHEVLHLLAHDILNTSQRKLLLSHLHPSPPSDIPPRNFVPTPIEPLAPFFSGESLPCLIDSNDFSPRIIQHCDVGRKRKLE